MIDVVLIIIGAVLLFGALTWCIAPYGTASRLGAFVSGAVTAALWIAFGG